MMTREQIDRLRNENKEMKDFIRDVLIRGNINRFGGLCSQCGAGLKTPDGLLKERVRHRAGCIVGQAEKMLRRLKISALVFPKDFYSHGERG